MICEDLVITTTLYDGQGIGNQLWAWATLRSIAEKKNYKYGIQAPWRFKGKEFFKIDFGKKVFGLAPRNPSRSKPLGIRNYYQEKMTLLEGVDVSGFDPLLVSIGDKTKIDGVFQCEDYIYESRDEISQILKLTRPTELRDSQCVVHIRGGDFKGNARVSLKSKYYYDAMKYILDVDKNVTFIVCTNDTAYARKVLDNASIEVISNYAESEIYSGPDGKIDYRVRNDFALLQNARYVITANSSFSWWGAWTNRQANLVVAPKYWANHNLSGPVWSTAGILTRDWNYIDTNGQSFTYVECVNELKNK
jgi:hypothetical protein